MHYLLRNFATIAPRATSGLVFKFLFTFRYRLASMCFLRIASQFRHRYARRVSKVNRTEHLVQFNPIVHTFD
jgi:hypothetical protein